MKLGFCAYEPIVPYHFSELYGHQIFNKSLPEYEKLDNVGLPEKRDKEKNKKIKVTIQIALKGSNFFAIDNLYKTNYFYP